MEKIMHYNTLQNSTIRNTGEVPTGKGEILTFKVIANLATMVTCSSTSGYYNSYAREVYTKFHYGVSHNGDGFELGWIVSG